MKFWNKNKEVRERCWTCVKLYDENERIKSRPLIGDYRGWVTWRSFDGLKIELQRRPGRAKFYMDIMEKEVWFERAKDATWFALTYTGDMS